MYLVVVKPKNNFLSLIIERQLLRHDRNAAISLVESTRLLLQCLDDRLVHRTPTIHLAWVDFSPIPKVPRHRRCRSKEHAELRVANWGGERTELLGGEAIRGHGFLLKQVTRNEYTANC